MAKPSKAVLDFMEQYKIGSDEIWEVHGSTWVVKHKALERVAVEQGITWDRPAMLECNSGDGIAALCVFGKLGERMEWSIGEALTVRPDRAGGNYKVTGKQAGYVYAMAEKRAKDRVILKLLNQSGGLYSEAESDEFEQRQNPHVTRAEDIMPATEYDERGNPVDNIPHPDPSIKALPKKNAKEIFSALQAEIWAIGEAPALVSWGERNANRVGALPNDWRDILRGVYREHLDAIRNQETGDQQRMAS